MIVTANKCKGSNSVIKVSRGNDELFSKELNFTSNSSTQTVLLEIEAKQAGLQHYHVALTPIKGEVTVANNVQDFFIDVIDRRQKILILSNSPNPDIAAIKGALEKNDNYASGISLASDYTKSFPDIILLYYTSCPQQLIMLQG